MQKAQKTVGLAISAQGKVRIKEMQQTEIPNTSSFYRRQFQFQKHYPFILKLFFEVDNWARLLLNSKMRNGEAKVDFER